MLMLGHTPYDDYAAFQRAPRVTGKRYLTVSVRLAFANRKALFKLWAEIILFLGHRHFATAASSTIKCDRRDTRSRNTIRTRVLRQ
jgi:hypothetical protein